METIFDTFLHYLLITFISLFVSLLIHIIIAVKTIKKRKETIANFEKGLLITVSDFYKKESIRNLEKIQYAINTLQDEIHKMHQQEVSWINSKKKLPMSNELVLIYWNSLTFAKEEIGFLSPSRDYWIILGLGGNKTTLCEVPQWKPLVQKKPALKLT